MNVFDIFGMQTEDVALSSSRKEQIEKITELRDAQFKEAEEAPVLAHEVVNAIHLKPGDIIIHDYSKFKITECGRGFGAGNEFGNYFWIKGCSLSPYCCTEKKYKEFWSFQTCPMIRLLEDNHHDH